MKRAVPAHIVGGMNTGIEMNTAMFVRQRVLEMQRGRSVPSS